MTNARIRIDPYFHPGQKEVHADPSRFKVIAAGRRWGKTKLGMSECIEVALEKARKEYANLIA